MSDAADTGAEPDAPPDERLDTRPAEWVDVVDDDDRVVATVSRRQMREQRLQHRAVFIAVTDLDGQVMIHQRAADKDLWPSWWDLCVGGVVSAGESYDVAAARELAEEAGVEGVALIACGSGRYVDESVAVIGRVYRVVVPRHLVEPRDGEVVAVDWVPIDELSGLIAQRPFLPDSVALVLPILLAGPR